MGASYDGCPAQAVVDAIHGTSFRSQQPKMGRHLALVSPDPVTERAMMGRPIYPLIPRFGPSYASIQWQHMWHTFPSLLPLFFERA